MPADPMLSPLLLKPRDAARTLALSERTLFAIAKRGEIPVIRCGRAVRYSIDDLRAWVERQKVVQT